MSGYYLAVVGKMRPWWVVRENVPASDDKDFIAALEMLGYRTIIVSANAAAFTGQNRRRDFIIGCLEEAGISGFIELYHRKGGLWTAPPQQNTAEAYPCLTTHRHRYDTRDGYIWDGRNALRVADRDERTSLAGFPSGWFDGVSETRIAKMAGNAVVPQVSMAIGMIIKEWIEQRGADEQGL